MIQNNQYTSFALFKLCHNNLKGSKLCSEVEKVDVNIMQSEKKLQSNVH